MTDARDAPLHGRRALARVREWPAASSAGVVLVERAAASPATSARATVHVADSEGDIHAVRPWASVTKLLVAMAVLVAVEEQTLGLDEPAGPPGSTVRHLLAHASGLAPDRRVALTAPGRRRIYSNAGYEVLADTLSAAAGMPLTDYLTAGVVHPLQMTGTDLPSAASPASGARGPLVDLLRLGGELLAPTLVAPATMAEAAGVAFAGLAGVLPGFGGFDPCDWGLGFEIKGTKSPHWTGKRNAPSTFGHFGASGSFLWVDPVARVGCAALSERAFGPWAAKAWPELSDAVVEEWGTAVPSPGVNHGGEDAVT